MGSIGVHKRTAVNKERANLKIITCDVNCKIEANKCVKLFMKRHLRSDCFSLTIYTLLSSCVCSKDEIFQQQHIFMKHQNVSWTKLY
jgi:hypothetical protein